MIHSDQESFLDQKMKKQKITENKDSQHSGIHTRTIPLKYMNLKFRAPNVYLLSSLDWILSLLRKDNSGRSGSEDQVRRRGGLPRNPCSCSWETDRLKYRQSLAGYSRLIQLKISLNIITCITEKSTPVFARHEP